MHFRRGRHQPLTKCSQCTFKLIVRQEGEGGGEGRGEGREGEGGEGGGEGRGGEGRGGEGRGML